MNKKVLAVIIVIVAFAAAIGLYLWQRNKKPTEPAVSAATPGTTKASASPTTGSGIPNNSYTTGSITAPPVASVESPVSVPDGTTYPGTTPGSELPVLGPTQIWVVDANGNLVAKEISEVDPANFY